MSQSETLNIRIKATQVQIANLAAFNSGKYRVIANQGSSRSSKTYSICQLLAIDIPMSSQQSISIVSPSLPHLKRGARRDFLDILETTGLYNDNSFNKTDNIYNYENGSFVEFFGADDVGKVRGPGRDILFINEANLLPYPIYKQLAIRTKQTIFIDFNPVDESSWVYEVADHPGNILIHSTYLDNPFLPQFQIDEIEALKEGDENLWKVFGLGQRGTSSEIIYTHWKYCNELPGKGEIVYGLDFGYNNPTALVKVEFYEGAVYAREMIYQTKLTTSDLIYLLKDLSIGKALIYCDAAEPKTIEEICRAGFNALPADKDVTEGIKKVKSLPLFITNDSSNLIKEIKSYRWKKDKEDKPLDEPVKMWDHQIDALRYCVWTHLIRPKPAQWIIYDENGIPVN